jgi:hypothetical protein
MSNIEMFEVAEKNAEELKKMQKFDDSKKKKVVRGDGKKMQKKFNLDKSSDLEEHNKQKAKGALEFLWNYNTVEATLLCCAVLILLFGLMFQDQQSVKEGSKEEVGLFIVTLAVMLFSIIYFGTVAFSEIYIGLGNSCSCVKRCMQQDTTRDRLTSQSSDIDHSLQSNIENPLANKRGEMASNPMHSNKEELEAQEETIRAQQEEIMRLKKENQAKMLSSFGSSAKKLKKKKGPKKAFSGASQEDTDVVMRTASVDQGSRDLQL